LAASGFFQDRAFCRKWKSVLNFKFSGVGADSPGSRLAMQRVPADQGIISDHYPKTKACNYTLLTAGSAVFRSLI